MQNSQLMRFVCLDVSPASCWARFLMLCFRLFFFNTGIVLTSMRAGFPYMTMLRHTLGLVPPSPALPWKLCHCALLQENDFSVWGKLKPNKKYWATAERLPKNQGPQPSEWNEQRKCWRLVQPNADAMEHRPGGQREWDGLDSAGGRRESSQPWQYLKTCMRTVSVLWPQATLVLRLFAMYNRWIVLTNCW